MLSPGAVLQNRYRVVRLIAHGGMGAVYEGRDERLSCTVALKETFFAEEEMSRAFRREASLLATLRHRALPKVIDHFSEGDGQFLVMEFIPGDDLGARLANRNEPFPPGDVVGWGLQALHVLEYLHSQRPPIIHRDIKPQNMKVTDSGEVVLLDFGLAKGATTTSPMSRSLQGYTLRYAPLEQIRGLGTDERSDLYSLAATLYHLMTNVPPPDALDRATALVGNQPDPLIAADQLNPQVPPVIAGILEAAMAQDRERRPPGAPAMRHALEAAISQSTSATIAIGSRATNAIRAPGTQPVTDRRYQTNAAGTASKDQTSTALTERAVASSAQSSAARPATTSRKRMIGGIVAVGVIAITALIVVAYVLMRAGEAVPMDGGLASTDKDKPSPITSRVIIFGQGGAEEHYFSLEAKRGVLALQLNVIAGGSTVTVELRDDKSQAVTFQDHSSTLVVGSSGHNEEAKARVLIASDSRLLMRVRASLPKEVRVYRLKLDGEVVLEKSKPASSSTVVQSLEALLTDRDRPVALKTAEVISGGTAKDLYYAFTAGPGQLKLTLDVLGKVGTASVQVFNEDSIEMRFEGGDRLSVSSLGHIEQDSALLLLERRQPVLLRITNTFPGDTEALRVRFSGPIEGIDEGGERDDVSSALALYFADRDNPNVLTTSEIVGRGNPKDAYYSFAAGPGKVSLILEASGNRVPRVLVEMFDQNGRRMRYENGEVNLAVIAGDEAKPESTDLELPGEQTLLMRISQSFPDDLRSFRLKLDGAVRFNAPR